MILTSATLRRISDMPYEAMVEALRFLADQLEFHEISSGRLEEFRRKDRERKRNSTGIPLEANGTVDSNNTTNSLSSKENITTTTSQRREKSAPPVSRGTRLSEDFQPHPNILEMARGLGLTDQQFADHVDRFKDYWRSVPGAKGRKIDWQATLRNRVKDIADRLRTRNGHQQKPDSIAAGLGRVRAAIERRESGDSSGRENSERISGLLKSA